MKTVKKIFYHIFIDGLSGMALGLFATLIIGTIIQQIGTLVGGTIGDYLFIMGKMAATVTGAGIGVGVAVKFRESPLVIISAASAGMMGSFASQILAGTLLTESTVALSGPGEPLGAFIAALVGIEVGHLVSGKTKIDILVTPLVSIISGSTVGLLAGPPISSFMVWLGSLVNWGTEQQPLLMGVVVSVVMGIVLTLPISSAALGIIMDLSGLAAGARHHRLLLQHDRFCRCQLPGKQNRRAAGAGAWHLHAAGSQYRAQTRHLAAGHPLQRHPGPHRNGCLPYDR